MRRRGPSRTSGPWSRPLLGVLGEVTLAGARGDREAAFVDRVERREDALPARLRFEGDRPGEARTRGRLLDDVVLGEAGEDLPVRLLDEEGVAAALVPAEEAFAQCHRASGQDD